MSDASVRDGEVPDRLVLVREGTHTLSDDALRRACARAQEVIGILGFSVLEVPGGGFEELARLRPLLRSRRRIMLARGADLVGAGFPLLPTLDHPHWTVVMPDLLDERLATVRAQFSEPVLNPAYRAMEG